MLVVAGIVLGRGEARIEPDLDRCMCAVMQANVTDNHSRCRNILALLLLLLLFHRIAKGDACCDGHERERTLVNVGLSNNFSRFGEH